MDPTLLLKSGQWLKLAKENILFTKPYILTYCLSKNFEMLKFISKLRQITDLPVIEISNGIFPMIEESNGLMPSPLEFVNLFSNASYVVTNSFHGTAFSCNLNRNFFSFIAGTKSTATNSRITDFLEMIGVEKRLFINCPDDNIDLAPLDYSNANRILDERRIMSFDFLKSALSC